MTQQVVWTVVSPHLWPKQQAVRSNVVAYSNGDGYDAVITGGRLTMLTPADVRYATEAEALEAAYQARADKVRKDLSDAKKWLASRTAELDALEAQHRAITEAGGTP